MQLSYTIKKSFRLGLMTGLAVLFASLVSCKNYLDQPLTSSETIPRTLKDLQTVLNRPGNFNVSGPASGELASDDYYLTTAAWQSASTASPFFVTEAYTYIWDKDPFGPIANSPQQWRETYVYAITSANLVLDVLPKIDRTSENGSVWDQVKGEALFYRGFNFHSLAQVFCRPYSSTASIDPGIVLRLDPNISATYSRATVQQTYDRIITDLKVAAELLPVKSLYISSPNKAAAYAALARTYLSMRDYTQAGYYADKSLQLYNSLLDYNTLLPVKLPAVPPFNKEILLYNVPLIGALYRDARFSPRVDSVLYHSYQEGDLRKDIFFEQIIEQQAGRLDTSYRWRGSYASNVEEPVVFNGLATDEVFLIRAECLAWEGKINEAIQDLNTLLPHRWKKDAFTLLSANSKEDALALIRAERRKELCFRTLRWSDLRRYNLEGANITLMRVIAGDTFRLPPNDLRWVMPIPLDEINRSGIEQNPR